MATPTKQDFEKCAKMCKMMLNCGWEDAALFSAHEWAIWYKSWNPRFDEDKFFRACGFGDIEIAGFQADWHRRK